MASFLRKVVAGPRAPHPEANLDLCYVTDNIIATSGPSATYPSRAYRNPLDQLVKFLDSKHGENWSIWEFRAEGTGYPDEAVYGRIKHFPWPDHHPPPFKLVPGIVGSMREWIHGAENADIAKTQTNGSTKEEGKSAPQKKVIVVHCKAGKGRSGSMAVAYLISQEGWTRAEALQRFTERRMRPGFGAGVSIPSQLRWIGYVERWAENGKQYLERAVEVKELHVWGLREGVKVAIEGYVDEGRKIKTFHVFGNEERDDIGETTVVESKEDTNTKDNRDLEKRQTDGSGTLSRSNSMRKRNSNKDDTPALLSVVTEVMKSQKRTLSMKRSNSKPVSRKASPSPTTNTGSRRSRSLDGNNERELPPNSSMDKSGTQSVSAGDAQVKTTNTVFRPTHPVILPTSDINISLERRARASYGWAMVTSVAHVWFNTFFEGQGPERLKERREALERTGAIMNKLTNNLPDGPQESGVFDISWEQLDGIKGSARKGACALDRLQVVWQAREEVKPSISPVPGPEQQTSQHLKQKLEESNESQDLDALSREDTNDRDSFESAQELQNPVDTVQSGVLITEPTHLGDVQESRPANWLGSIVRKGDSDAGSPMARRLGLRQEGERPDSNDDREDADGKTQRWKAEREHAAGEDQPELDESSDEDGTEGIQRGVRLSMSEKGGEKRKSIIGTRLKKMGLRDGDSVGTRQDGVDEGDDGVKGESEEGRMTKF